VHPLAGTDGAVWLRLLRRPELPQKRRGGAQAHPGGLPRPQAPVGDRWPNCAPLEPPSRGVQACEQSAPASAGRLNGASPPDLWISLWIQRVINGEKVHPRSLVWTVKRYTLPPQMDGEKVHP